MTFALNNSTPSKSHLSHLLALLLLLLVLPASPVANAAPTITGSTVPSNGTYTIGQNLDFTVTYSEAVAVSTGGGTPYITLTLDTGGSVQAAYDGGSTSTTLTFRYTVATGNADANGIAAASSITLNGGTIESSGNVDAPTTGLGFGTTTAVLVDGVVPTVSSSNRQTPSTASTNATSVVYRVTFSEAVTGVDTSDFTLTATGTADGGIASVSEVSGAVYDVSVNTISGDGTLRLDLNNAGTGIQDSAANAITAGYTSGQTYAIDSTAPGVTSVGVPTNGTYLADQNLDFTVNWTESVTVDTSGGTPAIAVMIGSTPRSATYLSGSPGTALVFRYTAQAGDLDADGIAIGALSLNSGTIADSAGNSATLTLNSVGSTASVNVDAIAPTVSSRTVPSDGTYKSGQNLDFTVTYSEAVTVVTGGGTPYIAVTLATGGSVQAAYNGGSTTTTLTFRYMVATGNLDADGIAAADAITLNGGTLKDGTGNDAQLTSLGFGSTAAVLVDAVAPTVTTINRQTPSTATTNATSVVYRVTFAETVTGVDAADFTLTKTGTADGSVASVSAVSGSVYDVTINTITGSGTLRLDLKTTGTGIADSATNAIGTSGYTSGQTYTLDTSAPTLASIVRQSPTTVHTDATSVTWRVTFSEGVTGVDSADFALTTVNGSGTGSVASVSAVSTSVYDVVASSLAGQRTLRLDVNSSGTGIADTAGNALTSGYTAGNFYIVGLENVFDTTTLTTASNLVSNLASPNKLAQRFTTGAAPATLSSVVATINSITGTPSPVVTINANNAGAPGTVVATLTNPTSLSANALNVWSGDVQLAASTTYWIVFAEAATTYRVAVSTLTSGGSGAWLTNPDYVLRYGSNAGFSLSGTLKIALGGITKPSITSTLSATGTVGSAFTYATEATNTPTSYAATGLPNGLSFDTETGVITGTPTTAGTYNVVLTATNGNGTGPTATLVISVQSAPSTDSNSSTPAPVANPFNPGGTQTQTSLDPSAGVEPTRAPSNLITNIDKLDNRVGISDNGVVVVLDNGLREPVKFRDDPPDNVLIAMPSQKPLDVQMSGSTLNIRVDPETPSPPKQTILGTATLLLPDGTQAKGLQLVQGEAAIGNDQPGGLVGGLELSKDSTLRSLVVQSGPEGGVAGFRKTSDGAGSVSAESGEIVITVRLKSSGALTLKHAQAFSLPGALVTTTSQALTDTLSFAMKAGEVARFGTQGELEGVFLGSLSGTVGKTGDPFPLALPRKVNSFPATTLLFDGGDMPARLGMPFSDYMNSQLNGMLHFSQRSDGLMEIDSPSGGKFYARTVVGFEVVPGAPNGSRMNADGSLSLTYGGIRSTWQPMLENVDDLADYLSTSLGMTTTVLDSGLVQVSGGSSFFYVVRPRFELLPGGTAAQGLTTSGNSLLYITAFGKAQQLDAAFYDFAQIDAAATVLGWRFSRAGDDLFVQAPGGARYRMVPDVKVEVLQPNSATGGVFGKEGQRLYFYYKDSAARQGFTLQPQ